MIVILMLNIIIQGIFYGILFILYLINCVREFSSTLTNLIRGLIFNLILLITWSAIMGLLFNNGELDLILGPADTGLYLLSLFSISTNYYYLCLLFSEKLVSPNNLVAIINERIKDNFNKIKFWF